MRSIVASFMLVLFISGSALAQLEDKVADRLWESATALDELVRARMPEYQRIFSRARTVSPSFPVLKEPWVLAVFTDEVRFPAGKMKERSVWLTVDDFTRWRSFGFQIGGQSVDLVMLFMTPDSMRSLLKDKIVIGGDVAATAGPVGRNASAETNATLHAEILTYAKAKDCLPAFP
jgi:lipid-binding SYLF domain-containing protein